MAGQVASAGQGGGIGQGGSCAAAGSTMTNSNNRKAVTIGIGLNWGLIKCFI